MIGSEDRLNLFRIPQKLYGREAEVACLSDAFRRCVRGNPQIMFVTGDAGVGKTALVHELHQYISQEKGLFAEGKFDQYNRHIPYSALIQAFRKLISQLLDSPDEDYKQYIGGALSKALDGNGSLIAGLIPELSLFIGDQPELEPRRLIPQRRPTGSSSHLPSSSKELQGTRDRWSCSWMTCNGRTSRAFSLWRGWCWITSCGKFLLSVLTGTTKYLLVIRCLPLR